MSKYLERAKEIRAIVEPHHNCTQSVLMSFTQSLDLDDETAYKIGVAFGGGMKTGITCGVITGALMALGLFGVDDAATTQKFINDFKAKHANMIDCADLLKANIATGVDKKAHCDGLVYEAVQMVEEILKERGKI